VMLGFLIFPPANEITRTENGHLLD
jgi:hypothetical protein